MMFIYFYVGIGIVFIITLKLTKDKKKMFYIVNLGGLYERSSYIGIHMYIFFYMSV